jgi:hypothetical protein
MAKFEIDTKKIRSEEYTYLTDSKTALWITKTDPESGRSTQAFFMLGGLALAIGSFLQGGYPLIVIMSLFAALFAGWFFIRSFLSQGKMQKDWVLYLGTGDSPIELYRSCDKADFDAKRDIIEQALISRPME